MEKMEKKMSKLLKFFIILFAVSFVKVNAADLNLKSPSNGEELRYGKTYTIKWDTLDSKGARTFEKVFEFQWSESATGPWNLLSVGKNAKSFKDVNSKEPTKAAGQVPTIYPPKSKIYVRMREQGNDEYVSQVVGPLKVTVPAAVKSDSILKGDITSSVTLRSNKVYQLRGVVHVMEGATLNIEPGTIILGDQAAVSAICINRGAKIYAKGTPEKPIIMTSGYEPGSRDRGDWGGLIVLGCAETNLGEAAIEGGIADDASTKIKGWYGKWNGKNDNEDSSGVIQYVRIEFAGIAESPDNELNSLTMGAVGSRTVIDHVMCSYGGDDSFEWFGGTVNAKYLIAYNGIDDDFDTDNGYSGKVQFVLTKRFADIADQSNSEAFESDNDSKSTENQPYTRAVFANVTAVGPIEDTSWTAGIGENKYHPKYLTAIQIRRNSRLSIVNSVFMGYPGGLELSQSNTIRAAGEDSIVVRYNDFYGIKDNKFFYLGKGTDETDKVTLDWLSQEKFGNKFKNQAGSLNAYCGLERPYVSAYKDFNPAMRADASYANTAKWDVKTASVDLNDDFFEKTPYRGAFGTERWDLPWAEYDPVNAVYDNKDIGDVPPLKLTSPSNGEELRYGKTYTIKWDTLDSKGARTFEKVFEFQWSESATGPWNLLSVGKNAKSFKDVNSKEPTKAAGQVPTIYPPKSKIYVRMREQGNDEYVSQVVGPLKVTVPAAVKSDSILKGDITSSVTLRSNKVYQLRGVVHVMEGATLNIEPGTIILGDQAAVSAICINRGAKIYAKGTPEKPIIMTSGYEPGSRDRGDWGGLIVLGCAETNLGEAAIEGGIADDASTKIKGWYGKWNGKNDNEDSSGVIQYVRIEFAGIAESPDNELNSLTMGAVGSRTVIDHVMCSYGGDDSFEWFGGTVNAKYLIAYNGIDDDFDTDNGYSGKVQFVLTKRFADIADQSNSEAFESDNDSKSTENQPYTRAVFANVTAVGPIEDTSWTAGIGENKYHPKYLTAIQIRRNSRLSIVNSVFMGYPGGVELSQNNTVRAAGEDSIVVRYNDFYGIKDNKFFYLGKGTDETDKVTLEWLLQEKFDNKFKNQAGSLNAYCGLERPYVSVYKDFNPAMRADASYANTAKWDVKTASVDLNDDFFEKTSYRGAFGTERWDLPWAEYDPVNAIYEPSSIQEEPVFRTLLSVSPNPANETAIVSYSLDNACEVTIKLFDITGNLVATFVQNEMQAAGTHNLTINVNKIVAGNYYLQLKSGEITNTISLPIAR